VNLYIKDWSTLIKQINVALGYRAIS